MANTTKQSGGKNAGGKNTSSKPKPSIPDLQPKKKSAPPKQAKQTSSAAQKSAPAKQPSTKQPKKQPDENALAARRQKTAIILFAAGIFLMCLALIKGVNVWLALHTAFIHTFGFCVYLWPIVLIYLAVVYAKNKSISSVGVNLGLGCGAILFIDAAAHIFSKIREVTATGAKYLSAVGISQQLGEIKSSESTPAGGYVGTIIGGGLARLFGAAGSIALILIVLAVLLMILTNSTILGVGSVLAKPAKKSVEKGAEFIGQAKENIAARKEERDLITYEVGGKKGRKKGGEAPSDDGIIRDESTFTIRGGAVPAEPVIPDLGGTQPAPVPTPTPSKPRKKPAPVVEGTSDEFDVEKEKSSLIIPEVHGYVKPPIDCLRIVEHSGNSGNPEDISATAQKLVSTLESFGVKARVIDACCGPSVTRYEVEPEVGVRINKITNLSEDIALHLASSGVRIAAIPNKSAIGIEVPNRSRDTVGMREILDSPQFRSSKSKLNVALGKDIAGNLVFADIAKMPHLLIAGTTGSGKSVCINTMIVSILYNASPEEVKMVLIDPKQVEFTVYNGIPHLEVPVVANPRKAAGALGWAVSEMEKRYAKFSEHNVRDIKGYNELCEKDLTLQRMHQIVIFIDELSDLMMVAPNEVEDSICRLAQMARAAGMHLVVATQRPSVNVITGVIKANIPSRLALSVSSQVDSRTIIDASGAEKLLGNGDMLFMPIGSSKPQRLQGCFISDKEVEDVVTFIKNNCSAEYNDEVMREIDNLAAATENPKKKGASSSDDGDSSGKVDETILQALEVLIKAGKASTTFLQNKLGWGYPKAARVMNQLEEMGYIPPKEGNKERRVLITLEQFYEMSALGDGLPSSFEPVGVHAADDVPFDEDEPDEIPFDVDESVSSDDAFYDEAEDDGSDDDDEDFSFTTDDDLIAPDDAEHPSDDDGDNGEGDKGYYYYY